MPWTEKDAPGRLWYLRRGNGLPAIAIHGAGGNCRVWANQLAGLRSTVDLVAPDLPGHGRSPGPSPATIAAFGSQILHAMDALRLPGAIVVGHSMGGAVAQWLALQAPEQVRGLVLIGTGARLRVSPQILTGIQEDFTTTTATITRWCYSPLTDAPTLDHAASELQAVAPEVLEGDYRACDGWDATTLGATITCPTLIIVGSEDRMTPSKVSYALQAAITGSELVVVPGAGHMVMLEAPDVVNAAIDEWLRKTKLG